MSKTQLNERNTMVGNLVKYDGKIYELDTIAAEFPTLNTDEFGIGVVDWNNIEPIPLTPEILVRLGAEKDTETDYRWFMLDGSIIIDVDDFGACVGGWWLDRTIEHLHQLQNLYFALTDKELTYTP